MILKILNFICFRRGKDVNCVVCTVALEEGIMFTPVTSTSESTLYRCKPKPLQLRRWPLKKKRWPLRRRDMQMRST